MAEKLNQKPTHRHVAEITGTGQFPLDMLRYDRAAPWEEVDSSMIERTLNPMIDRRGEWKIRITRLGEARAGWSLGRWDSYKCQVREINGYEPRSAND
jgi:hypothetical protein